MDEQFWVVNVEFKDGSSLKNCAIFNEKPENGQIALNDTDIIKQKFTKLPWYSRWDGWIYFQNRNINGVFHVENVKEYKLDYINDKEF